MEPCRRCYIQLPPVFTYLGLYLLTDPQAGMWSLLITEWAVRTAANLLVEAYDQYRVWYIQKCVRAAIRHLDMRVPLAGVANREEVAGLLDYIDSFHWDEVSLGQSGRHDGCSGGSGSGVGNNARLGDFINFDQW